MHHVILIILLGISMNIPIYHVIIQNDQKNKKIAINNSIKDWALQQESAYIVEGTITKVTVGDLSKTSRVEHLVTHLDLKTSDSPPKNLQFRRYPAPQSDKQLRVGQRVSIIARKHECLEKCVGEYADILYLEPL